jgi:hypothetical protein
MKEYAKEIERIYTSIRRKKQQVHVSRLSFNDPTGKAVTYIGMRLMYLDDDGNWKPDKKKPTIQHKDLVPLANALLELAKRQENILDNNEEE